MATREEIIEKILKVRALAERGVGGEKENAAQMVDRMMEEYDITEDDLREDVVERRWFRFSSKDKYAKKLMGQIIYSVTGENSYWTIGRKAKAGIDCTASQGLEIAAKYEFYYAKYLEDLDVLYSAFISKNDIYPSDDLVEDEDDGAVAEDIDLEHWEKVRNMRNSLEKHEFRKQLGGN